MENEQENQGIQNTPNIDVQGIPISSPSVQQTSTTASPQPQSSTQTQSSIQSQPPVPSSEASTTPKPGGSNKVFRVGVIFLIIAVVVGIIYAYSKYQKYRSENQKANTNPAPTQTVNQQLPSPTPDPTNDWSAYATSTYTVKYPGDLVLKDEGGNILSFSKWGPTQTKGTELFDGFAITFVPKEHIMLMPEGSSPKDYADAKIKQIESLEMSKITEEPKPITINGYEGITYTEEGLGTFKQIILGSDDGNILMISILVADPGNLGFQETVDQILSTLELTPGI